MSSSAGSRLRVAILALALLSGGLLASSPSAHAADDGDGELTLDAIVSDVIVGHAEDGNYLNFDPFGTVELPRIMVARTADGTLTLDVYGSTKGLLKGGAYGLAHDGEEGDHEEVITEASALQEAFASKAHLHGDLVRTEGYVVADLSITRHFVFGLLAMGIVLGLFIVLAQRYKRGVGRTEAPRGVLQNMMELMVVFIRDEVAKPNIQGEKWRTFLPYLLSAFFFILMANILGLVPFAGAATSNIAVTGVLAIMTFAIGLVYGSKDHYKHMFLGPPDAPWPIRVILVPIELIGMVMRHLALAIRLFANMMGGSLIIFSLIGLVFIMNVLFGEAMAFGTSIISIGFTVFILLLKLLVAFIQAYVFTILSALFIGMAVEEHDHGEHETAETHAGAPAHADGALEDRLDAVDDTVDEVTEPAPA
ncbi:MAG: F0F1 ATP synthase subunit A [Salinibacter sp.]